MNYLIKAMDRIGIYYTPTHLSFGSGKTRDADWCSRVLANPPFAVAGGDLFCIRCGQQHDEPWDASADESEACITENSRCSSCGYWFDESELETLGFVVEESGVQPGTPDGPAVHWATGYIVCPQCGVQLPYEVSE